MLPMTLFKLKIDITNSLNPGIDDYLYVDEFCLTFKSKYMSTAERQLQ